ncbi:protein of unknown function [Duganella sp. CF402]|uniref:DUF4124 domain-containing protein n=1 Tax=unclassified Duganella TaxID=2636909 RepID=UPI0008C6712E|nr:MULTISPECIES: DUF4124 domain-containing protein [unclassified Duganella]RZT10678.1 uncharacterized protein DUF4124 [Duganella sp. BK701]SEL02416.1 protein of unknown function [Duganella sp. CF402]
MNILIVAALAGAVYKCTVDGKVTYSDSPCAAGASVVLETPAAPPADPAAGAALRNQQKQADTLQKSRLKREEREEREAAREAKDAAVQRKKCDQLKLKKRWADEDARRATGSATETARLRAHRAGEAMALECPR